MEVQASQASLCLCPDRQEEVDKGQGREEGEDNVSEWQPIETAPKDDDTEILTWCEGKIAVATRAYDDLWWVLGLPAYKPTHWMPLPKPPVTVASK